MLSSQFYSIFFLLILLNFTKCSIQVRNNKSFASIIDLASNKEILSVELVLSDECHGLFSFKQLNNDTYINFYDCEKNKDFKFAIIPSCLLLNYNKYIHLTTIDKRRIIIKENMICIGKKDDTVNLIVSNKFKKASLLSKYKKLKERDRSMLNYQFFN